MEGWMGGWMGMCGGMNRWSIISQMGSLSKHANLNIYFLNLANRF